MLRSARQLSRTTILASLFLATLLAIPVAAQQSSSPSSEPPVGFPVTVEGNQIFLIYDGIGSVTAAAARRRGFGAHPQADLYQGRSFQYQRR